jgi:tol-pal system protein YbgF
MQIRQLSVLAILTFSSALVVAQVQVREAGGGNRAAAPAVAQAGSNDLMVSLYNQVEALQQEVQTLRGVVEEQGYQLKRLQTEQRDRYIDIDRRLSTMAPTPALSGATTPLNASATPVTPVSAAPTTTVPASSALNGSSTALNSANTVVTSPPATSSATASTGAAALDEQELYRTALNLLLEESKYDEAISMFQTYTDNFPQGRLLTNALYWQGEAYLLVSGFSQARDVFARLLNEFPQDAKAAGAMLKLGMAYKQMGDAAQASDTWRNLKIRFPESANEIRLAEEYLKAQ